MPASRKTGEKAPPAPARKQPQRIGTFVYWDFELKEGESLEIVNEHVDAIWGYAKGAKKSSRFYVCSADWNTLAPELRKGLKKSGLKIFAPRVEDVIMGDEALWSNLKEHGHDMTVVLVKRHECHAIINKITSLGSNVFWISSLGPGKLVASLRIPTAAGTSFTGQSSSSSNLNVSRSGNSQSSLAGLTLPSAAEPHDLPPALPREDASHSGPVVTEAAKDAGIDPAVSVFWDYSGRPIPRTLGEPRRTVAMVLDRIKSFIGAYGHNPQFYAYVHPAQDGSYPKKLHAAFSAAKMETRLLQPRAKYRTHQQIMRDVAAYPKEHPNTKTIVLIARESTINELSALITLFQQLGLTVVCITTLPTGAEGQEITAAVHSPSKGGPNVASGQPIAGGSIIPSPQETGSDRLDGPAAMDEHEELEGQAASEELPPSLPETQVPETQVPETQASETQVDAGNTEGPYSRGSDQPDGPLAMDEHEEPEGQAASEAPPPSLPETQVPETQVLETQASEIQVDAGDTEEPHSPFYVVDDLEEPEDTLFFPASSDFDLPSDSPSDLSYPVDDIPIALLGNAAEGTSMELAVDYDYPSRSGTPRAMTPTREPSDKELSTDEEWDMDLSDLDNWEERSTSGSRSDASESDIDTVDAVEVSGWACLGAPGKRKKPLDEDCSLVDMSRMRLRKKKRLTVF